ncbi:MAG TPA: hypothetical protein VK324_17400, partial [Tepidisphaeraceae bacterium]|nr:hypothetical protein [Tepidisphaeraceae bacterium]
MPSQTTIDALIARNRRRHVATAARVAAVVTAVVGCGYYTGLLDVPRLWDGVADIADLVAESLPPDFRNWRDWLRPLWDTLAMSVAGTALAVAISFPLGLLAARNTSPHASVYYVARTMLNALRSV